MHDSTNIGRSVERCFPRNNSMVLAHSRRGPFTRSGLTVRRAVFLAVKGAGILACRRWPSVLAVAALMILGLGNRELNGQVPCAKVARSDGQRPRDVSNDVEVSISGVRLDRQTGYFVGIATLTNRSHAGIQGPISIVFTTGGGLRMMQAAGTTCGVAPVGRSYATVPVEGNLLNPGATVQMKVEFENPGREPIHATTQVLAGSGVR